MEFATDPQTQLAPIWSEIGELRRVLVHRPGRELERITPRNRAELLFDDILWLERAQEEHDAFTEILADRGVHVEALGTLLGEALDVPAARETVLRSTLRAATLGPRLEYEVGAWLESLPGEELAAWCIGGVAFADLPFASSSFTASTAGSDDLVIPPLPNSYYTRDPSTWVGPGVVLSAMAHRVRRREVLHLEMIYRHHPRFLAASPGEAEGGPVIFGEDRPGTAGVEGGDLLALAPGVLVAACGGRTRSGTVEALAAELFAAGAATEVLAVQLPGRGGEVHLDTVFSQIDHDAFVVYADLVERLPTYALRPGRNGRIDGRPRGAPVLGGRTGSRRRRTAPLRHRRRRAELRARAVERRVERAGARAGGGGRLRAQRALDRPAARGGRRGPPRAGLRARPGARRAALHVLPAGPRGALSARPLERVELAPAEC
jgi:arginine deiminase